MANKILSLLVMGSISLVLFTMLSFATIGRTYPGPVWQWSGWVASLALTMLVLWQAETPRIAWGYQSLIAGIVSFVLFLVILFIPVSASAPYEPGADWLRTVNLTPPIISEIRVALASGYFGITMFIVGAVLVSSAYLLLHFRSPPRRHRR